MKSFCGAFFKKRPPAPAGAPSIHKKTASLFAGVGDDVDEEEDQICGNVNKIAEGDKSGMAQKIAGYLVSYGKQDGNNVEKMEQAAAVFAHWGTFAPLQDRVKPTP